MSDLYSEVLVARKPKPTDNLIRLGIIVLLVLFTVAGVVITPFLLIGAVACAAALYFILPRLHVEFEYLYVNGEFDIDKIYGQRIRKKAMTFSLEKIECAAPLGSHRLDSFQNGYTTVDFSAQDPSDPPYVFVYTDGSEKKLIRMQMDKKILEDLKRRMPRSVFDN
jgi:hypothetical protein